MTKTQVIVINTSPNHLERFPNNCNTNAEYENILVTDIRMEKMSDKIFVQSFSLIRRNVLGYLQFT